MWYLYRVISGEGMGQSVNQYLNLPSFLSQIENPTVTADFNNPWIYDGAEVRNATQGEINGFPAARYEDDKTRAREVAVGTLGKTQSESGLLIRALALVVMDEINLLRAQHSLPPRNANQIKTAIQNKIETLQAD